MYTKKYYTYYNLLQYNKMHHSSILFDNPSKPPHNPKGPILMLIIFSIGFYELSMWWK